MAPPPAITKKMTARVAAQCSVAGGGATAALEEMGADVASASIWSSTWSSRRSSVAFNRS